jgi:hypothetical protein
MASAWAQLGDYLTNIKTREIILSFQDIEGIIGRPLPKSAELPQFWANVTATGRPQREACRKAGFNSFLIQGASYKVRFERAR